MATPADPLQTLQAALAQPANSPAQAEQLAALRAALEARPQPLPILCTTLLGTAAAGVEDSLLKRFVLDLLHYGVARAALAPEQRTQLAAQSLDVLAGLLLDPSPRIVKVVVQTFAAVYPLLFLHLCQNRSLRGVWDTLSGAKTRIIGFATTPGVSAGVRLAAIKFLQSVILVQTRGVADPRLQNRGDPNLSMLPADHPFLSAPHLEAEGTQLLTQVLTLLYTSPDADVLTAIVNSWAPLVRLRPTHTQLIITSLASWRAAALPPAPAFAVRSVEKAVRVLLAHIGHLPAAAPFGAEIRGAVAALDARAEQHAAAERARRAALKRAAATPPAPVQPPPEKRARLEEPEGVPDFAGMPGPLVTELVVASLAAISEGELKTLVYAYGPPQPASAVATLPPAAAPAPAAAAKSKSDAAAKARAKAAEITASAPRAAAGTPDLPAASTSTPTAPAAPAAPAADGAAPADAAVKEEPVDPLKMDIDDDDDAEPDAPVLPPPVPPAAQAEAEAEDEAAATGLDALLALDLRAPPPRTLGDAEKAGLVRESIGRIQSAADGVGAGAGDGAAVELWMLLVVRLITRGAEPAKVKEKEKAGGAVKGEEGKEAEGGKKEEGEGKSEEDTAQELAARYEQQDQLRAHLFEYIMADFAGRMQLATMWMNEEWYGDQLAAEKASSPDLRHNYDTWLSHIVSAYLSKLTGKDRTFGRFLLNLPSVPADVFQLLRDLCVDPARLEVGVLTLRDFVAERPTLRAEALGILLELTTHESRATRGPAIIVLKRWVGDVQPMDGMIRAFALQLLRRLQARAPAPAEGAGAGEAKMLVDEGAGPAESSGDAAAKSNDSAPAVTATADSDENMEDGQIPQDEVIRTQYLTDELELPAKKDVVLQHVELLFALSTKVPELLKELFAAYGEMDTSVQEAIQDLITPLIRKLGPTDDKLLAILRHFPPGADTLVLRVLAIFTEKNDKGEKPGPPPPPLVAAVKAVVAERDLDARFLVPVVSEFDKADIVRAVPRIAALLDGSPARRALVRTVFGQVVASAPAAGFSSSNAPRQRASELLSPAELMVLLHNQSLIALKPAKEAIGICFGMPEVFRSEVLAAVMQQIVDEPALPILFMWMVIQAVSTYKSLVGFVSTTLLSRLITKKIWTSAPLWEGFVRCAKAIAPHSFNALLQLPKEQLREVVEKQPQLKGALREFVTKRAGGNRARVAGFLDIFGETDAPAPVPAPSPAPSEGAQEPPPPAAAA